MDQSMFFMERHCATSRVAGGGIHTGLIVTARTDPAIVDHPLVKPGTFADLGHRPSP